MPAFQVTGGILRGALVSDAGIDNSLPGEGPGGPVDPGFGRPPPIGGTLPEPPPGIWPPPSHARPIVPIIDNTLPVPPGTIWPSPGRPPHVDAGLPVPPSGTLPVRPPVRPDNTLPGGGQIDNALPSQTFWMLCYAPSLGWKYVAVDPSLRPGHDLPPHPQPK